MFRPVFLIAPGVVLLTSFPVFAQAIPNISTVDRHRLTRDLTPTNSQDFFKQGQAQFEREIQLLERRSQVQREDLLKIDPATRNLDKLIMRSQPLTIHLKR